MKSLVQQLEETAFEEVSSYIQSSNVVLKSIYPSDLLPSSGDIKK